MPDRENAEARPVGPKAGSDEAIALAALRQYNPSVEAPNVFTKIPNFFGGTLCLVEFKAEGSNEEWCVLVRGGRGIVWYDYEQALQFAASSRSAIRELTSASTVVGIISIGVVLAVIILYAWKGAIDEPFRAALATVLGFWFGQAVPRKDE